MELGQLRALRELRDRGSIAAVAEAMLVTSSSISQQLSALQRTMSVPLTYRDGRRTALTDAGLALAAAAVEVELALSRATNAVERFQEEPAGTVSVAAFHSAGLALFAPLLTAFEGREGTQLSLNDEDVAQEDFVGLTADFDLVISHRLTTNAPWPTTVRAEPLMLEPLDVAMRRDHRLAGKRVLRPEDLREESWVAAHAGFPVEVALAPILKQSGGPRIRHRINEFFVVASVVAASDCVALLPRYTTQLHPDLVLRPLASPGLSRAIDCLARPETLERSNARSVLRELTALSADLVAAKESERR
jgi:DNA-binding transcriptional LysR family regulator